MKFYTIALLAAALVSSACAGPRYGMSARATATISEPGAHALAVVRVKTPWYAPRFVVRRRFRDALPEYEALRSLETKYFTISDLGEFGGIYLFQTRQAADAYYSDAWRRGIRERRGVDPDLLVLDAPLLVFGRTALDAEPIGARSVSYPATATLVLWPTEATHRDADLAGRVAEHLKRFEGLVRGAVVVGAS